ncbi:hypothetical protein FYJ24_09015 [Actinomycetaceae bacterium WB03_NA08]|uniref:Uncharacterized protein n=1 Tax=Scrofimicrobium canadense TaxID=2652290 RepID=A0A6N7W8Z5_9ACTO|nr:hypothetical protein [Scrofimicrobium canadense]
MVAIKNDRLSMGKPIRANTATVRTNIPSFPSPHSFRNSPTDSQQNHNLMLVVLRNLLQSSRQYHLPQFTSCGERCRKLRHWLFEWTGTSQGAGCYALGNSKNLIRLLFFPVSRHTDFFLERLFVFNNNAVILINDDIRLMVYDYDCTVTKMSAFLDSHTNPRSWRHNRMSTTQNMIH